MVARATSLVSEPMLMILPPRPRRDHATRRFAADLERGGEVGLDDAPPVIGREFNHWLAQLDAGVVDEDVDGDALGVEALERAPDRRLVRDVERARQHPKAFSLEGLRRRRELRPVAPVEHDRSARLGETFRHREPEPGRGAGDKRGLAGEIEEG